MAAMQKPDLFKGVVLIAPAIKENPESATPFKVSGTVQWTDYYTKGQVQVYVIYMSDRDVHHKHDIWTAYR